MAAEATVAGSLPVGVLSSGSCAACVAAAAALRKGVLIEKARKAVDCLMLMTATRRRHVLQIMVEA